MLRQQFRGWLRLASGNRQPTAAGERHDAPLSSRPARDLMVCNVGNEGGHVAADAAAALSTAAHEHQEAHFLPGIQFNLRELSTGNLSK